jgi:hypothetical protein
MYFLHSTASNSGVRQFGHINIPSSCKGSIKKILQFTHLYLVSTKTTPTKNIDGDIIYNYVFSYF